VICSRAERMPSAAAGSDTGSGSAEDAALRTAKNKLSTRRYDSFVYAPGLTARTPALADDPGGGRPKIPGRDEGKNEDRTGAECEQASAHPTDGPGPGSTRRPRHVP